MKLMNVLIVVKDIERSRQFYHDLFGLELILDNGGNMILTEGLVLQRRTTEQSFPAGRSLCRIIQAAIILKSLTWKDLFRR